MVIIIIIVKTTQGNCPPLYPHTHTRSGRLFLGLVGPALQFAIDSVRVLAAAAGPVDLVVAALARLQAPLDGRVAQQTGEQYRQ